MPPKEKPLLDAVRRVDPLPKVVFANPVVTGFICIMMCAVFGAIGAVLVLFGGGERLLDVFETARGGAIFTVAFAALVLVLLIFRAMLDPEEATPLMLFVLGGVLGIAVLAMADRLAREPVRAWLETAGSIIYDPDHHP